MKAAPEEVFSLPLALMEMASQRGYSKVFAKVPETAQDAFSRAGYKLEAAIPKFFRRAMKVCFMSLFLKRHRSKSQTVARNGEVLHACRANRSSKCLRSIPEGFLLRICKTSDAKEIADVYAKVFASYPFPITDPEYIRQTMKSHVVYFGVRKEGQLIALSSAEMDLANQNVEMTDFATLPDFRRHGWATILLNAMEVEMRNCNVATAYTIARATSFGMNITFARMGYEFSGQLINNTNIGGQFEDMNVWHKPLTATNK